MESVGCNIPGKCEQPQSGAGVQDIKDSMKIEAVGSLAAAAQVSRSESHP
jgi:hypothetical protein